MTLGFDNKHAEVYHAYMYQRAQAHDPQWSLEKIPARGGARMHQETTALTQELYAYCQKRGADLCGVADLIPAHDFIVTQGNAVMGQFPRAVALGMRLSDAIVDGHSPDETQRESLYWHHVYRVVTPALDILAYEVGNWLTRHGFRTFPIPGSTPYNTEKLVGMFSHKLAAHLAGLGWISKSCLLVTEAFGPRVRFVTVLTDAPLETDAPLDGQCGKCQICIDACPAGAFTGVEFRPTDDRDVRFDVFKCSEYRSNHACGLCVSTCPKGRSRIRQRRAGVQ
jgi:epoxyqueuosine reductase